jgi:hypothetical protein
VARFARSKTMPFFLQKNKVCNIKPDSNYCFVSGPISCWWVYNDSALFSVVILRGFFCFEKAVLAFAMIHRFLGQKNVN